MAETLMADAQPACTTTIVIPCFNEAERLQPGQVAALAAEPGIRVLLVDDGSTDATLELLRSIANDNPDVDVMSMAANRGKAEAVRLGLVHALGPKPDIVGFCDADMATPVEELIRLNRIAGAETELAVVLASRVALLGHRVDRSIVRHYLGRLFATASSIVLRTRVYDTQCGTKYFRNTTMLHSALAEPFHSRWSFDVELLGRLLQGGRGERAILAAEMLEVPLTSWSDVGGSKLTPFASLRSAAELLTIARALSSWNQG